MWLNRTTKQKSEASPGDMERAYGLVFTDGAGAPVSNAFWLYRPNLDAVEGFPSKYWIVTGDVVTLMDQPERDAVDAAELTASRDSTVSQLDGPEDILRAFMLLVVEEFNNHATRLNGIKDGISAANSLSDVKAAMVSVPTMPTRTAADLKAAIRNNLGS